MTQQPGPEVPLPPDHAPTTPDPDGPGGAPGGVPDAPVPSRPDSPPDTAPEPVPGTSDDPQPGLDPASPQPLIPGE